MSLRHALTPLILAALLGATAAAPTVTAAEQRPPAGHEMGPAGLVLQPEDDASRQAAAAELRYPDAPTGSYRPRFVRQTGKNCAFASGAMLIDMWTTGDVRPSQGRLRTASRVPATQGVSFAELSRSVARVSNIDLRYSPGGGDPLTWEALLSRLARGGGAVIGGAYSRLPRHYQRWARDFAGQGAAASGHAVYVERYQRTRGGGRVWMMDPLAKSAGYIGEWISVRALRQFAWRNSRGLVSAAATPEPPPLAGYDFGTPQVDEWSLPGEQLTMRIPVSISSGWPAPKRLSVKVHWQLLEAEPELASIVSLVNGETTDDDAGDTGYVGPEPELGPQGTARAILEEDEEEDEEEGAGERERDQLVQLDVRDDFLFGTLRAPREPGLYVMSLELHRRDGSAFAAKEEKHLSPVDVRIRGPLAAEMSSPTISSAVVPGSMAQVALTVANRGSTDWLDAEAALLVATWETPVGSLPAGSATIALEAGDEGTVTLMALVPTVVDEGELTLELFSAEGAPLSAFGTEPLRLWLRFAEPPTSRVLPRPPA